MKLENPHDEKNVQPRVQARGGGIGDEAVSQCGPSFEGSWNTRDGAATLVHERSDGQARKLGNMAKNYEGKRAAPICDDLRGLLQNLVDQQ